MIRGPEICNKTAGYFCLRDHRLLLRGHHLGARHEGNTHPDYMRVMGYIQPKHNFVTQRVRNLNFFVRYYQRLPKITKDYQRLPNRCPYVVPQYR